LRAGLGRHALDELAAGARGPGAVQLRRVARAANGRAANPFESCTRAISLDVPNLRLKQTVDHARLLNKAVSALRQAA
jgi:hypothetical protein